MNRRTFLTTSGMAALGFGLGGCAARRQPGPVTVRPLALAPVRAAWDRVIRTTVGLRPHRDSGFVLRPEKLDDRLLIHNYGHGGAGMSLSWGTGLLAAEIAADHQDRRAAVVGCGAVGLACARQLQRRGFNVTIYAMAVPPYVTSNMSLAGFTPASGLVEADRRTPEWDAQYRRAADIAYRQLHLMAGPYYGVSWLDNYSLTDDPSPPPANPDRPNLNAGFNAGREVLQPGEHPFPTKYAIRNATIRIEPSIYLDALVRDFLLWGGHIVIRKFDTPRDLMTLGEPIIVNCTGLGARDLFGDQEVVPLKGQLTVLVPQPEVNYHTQGGLRPQPERPGSLAIHMMPRSDGIALGGTSQRGVWTLEPDEEERRRIVDSHIEVFSAMKGLRA
jgi:D-amino-acid oxidase